VKSVNNFVYDKKENKYFEQILESKKIYSNAEGGFFIL
jgi:hypothetical protein